MKQKDILNCVAIAGADEAVKPEELASLTDKFPFVEWSILYDGEPRPLKRFPSEDWIIRLTEISQNRTKTRKEPLRLSLHLCGEAVGNLLLGNFDWFESHKDLLRYFQRIQLNVTYQKYEQELSNLPKRIRCLPSPFQIIVQLNGTQINQNIGKMLFEQGIDTVYLFDLSGGTGKTTENWLPPVIHSGGTRLCGYAGGLNPENLRENLDKIMLACNGIDNVSFWADLESGVRNPVDDSLNMNRICQVLQIAKEWIDSDENNIQI